MMLERNWATCRGGNPWCGFHSFTMDDEEAFGVYVIFTQDEYGYKKALYVGQGKIWDRIIKHRVEKNIPSGALVTWARIPEIPANNIERYLIAKLSPSMNAKRDEYDPHGTTINLPF